LKLFEITQAGLLAITILVIALWSVIAFERAALDRAARDSRTAFRTMERLQRQSTPASEPAPHLRSRSVRSS
jgi:hypothetical protein